MHDSTDNSSPQRRNDISDKSPSWEHHDSSGSNDSPTWRRKFDSYSDALWGQKKVMEESDSDTYIPRKRMSTNSDSDLSALRKGIGSDSDLSPQEMSTRWRRSLCKEGGFTECQICGSGAA